MKKTEKISRMVTLILFISLLAEMKFAEFKYVTAVCLIILYAASLVREKLTTKKCSLISTVLCIFAIIWVIGRLFFLNPMINVLGQLVIYGFLINSSKKMTGKWNKKLFIVGILSISMMVVGGRGQSTALTWIIYGFYIVAIIMFIDPILTKIALMHRQNRIMEQNQKATN